MSETVPVRRRKPPAPHPATLAPATLAAIIADAAAGVPVRALRERYGLAHRAALGASLWVPLALSVFGIVRVPLPEADARAHAREAGRQP